MAAARERRQRRAARRLGEGIGYGVANEAFVLQSGFLRRRNSFYRT